MTLVRLRSGESVGAAVAAMREAGEQPGLVEQRLAEGDQLFGWETRERKLVSFGWVRFRRRSVGPITFAERPGRAFLYNFHTFPAWRAKHLYTDLLTEIRHALGGDMELLVEVNERNPLSRRGVEKAGFIEVATILYVSVLDRWDRTLATTMVDRSLPSLFAPVEATRPAKPPTISKKRDVLASVMVRSGVAPMLARRWHGVVGLNYHRIGNAADTLFDRGLWSATAEAFDEQLRFLARHTDVISIADLQQAVSRKRGRYSLVTFDDGYRDNYEVAYPILKANKLPAAFFLSTSFLDSPSLPWWDEVSWMVRTSPRRQLELEPYFSAPIAYDDLDREGAIRSLLRAFKAMPSDETGEFLDAIAVASESGRYRADTSSLWMTWDMIREMRANGMAIGGHTTDHLVLSQLTEEQQRAQIEGCARRLVAELGEPMRWFSYPVGNSKAFNDGTRRCLDQCGVEFAFTYYGGVRTFDDWDRYDVRRLAIETEIGPDLFRAMVLVPQIFSRTRQGAESESSRSKKR